VDSSHHWRHAAGLMLSASKGGGTYEVSTQIKTVPFFDMRLDVLKTPAPLRGRDERRVKLFTPSGQEPTEMETLLAKAVDGCPDGVTANCAILKTLEGKCCT
jgi:hypothetical protein